MLELINVEVRYHEVILVLKGVSLEVPTGQIVCLLGANGAGKSTTLKAISGMLHVEEGRVAEGSVEFDGRRIDKLEPYDIAKAGILQVAEGRRIFQHLTVEENLISATIPHGDGATKKKLGKIYSYFPKLAPARNRTSGYLSGGEQQMLVIGRGLMGEPKVLLLDEPSLGIAPLLVKEIFDTLIVINNEEKTTMLLVEQNTRMALKVSGYGYVLENGRVVLDGPSSALAQNEDIREFYLGLSDLSTKRTYRDFKHYSRRKRWL